MTMHVACRRVSKNCLHFYWALVILLVPIPLCASSLDDANFPVFYNQIADLWLKKKDFVATANAGKTLLDELTPNKIKLKHQDTVYRICASLFETRDYGRASRCFSVLKAAVKANGDLKGVRSFPIFIEDEIWGWPIIPKIDLLLAEMWLELGQPHKALAYILEAYAAYPAAREKGSIWQRDVDFYFLYGFAIKWQMLSTMAIAYKQIGDSKKANETLEILSTIGTGSIREYKSYAESLLIRTNLALGNYQIALDIAKGKSEAADRVSEIGTVILASSLMAIIAPGEALLRGSFGLANAAFSELENLATRFAFAHAYLELGDIVTSKREIDEVLAAPGIKGMGGIYWSALYDRGRIAEREAQIPEAIRLYSQAISEIEQQRSTINTEGAKIGFFGDKQAVYQALIRLQFRTGSYEEAFLTGERSKSRALVDILANKQDFYLANTEATKINQLLSQSQVGEIALARNTSADMELANRLSKGSRSSEGADQIDVRTVLEEVRTLKVAAKDQLAVHMPQLSSLISVPQVSLADIQQKLPADQVILSYYYDAENLYAFVIDGKTLKAMRLERKGLEDDIQAFRQAIAKRDESHRQNGQALYQRLIAPVAGQLRNPKLLIAGHGALHYLPFAALTDGQSFLLDRYQITVLPSASTLKFVGNIKASDKPGTLLAFGNPDLGDQRYNLSFAEKEAREVAGLFEKSALFLGKDASKKNFKEYGQGFRYLHFATHGKFDPVHPLDSALLLSSKSVANMQDQLTIGELYSIRIDADLVTLSACETGLGKVANGDDVVGLVRGFMYAGANQIVSTLWEIDDTATESLMTNFYQRIKAGENKAAALRASQRDVRQKYSNPFFWAAFQITGGADNASVQSKKPVVTLRH